MAGFFHTGVIMLRVLVTSFVLLSTPLLATEPVKTWDFSTFPSLQEQYETAKLNELSNVIQTEPYFAGKLVDITVFGKRVAIDRRGENNPHPGGSPPNSGIGALTDFLNGIDAAAKADLEIGVSREWYETGILKEERWNIVIHGSYHISKEELKPDKEDKKTGEAE
jgi:hypothetical protein